MAVFSNTQIIEVDTTTNTLDYFRADYTTSYAYRDLFGHRELGIDDQIDQNDVHDYSNEDFQMEILIDQFMFL